jgi:hypothetical protein
MGYIKKSHIKQSHIVKSQIEKSQMALHAFPDILHQPFSDVVSRGFQAAF